LCGAIAASSGALAASTNRHEHVLMASSVPPGLEQRIVAIDTRKSGSSGGPTDEETLIKAVLRGFPPDFVEVKLGIPPSGFEQNDSLGEVGTRWVYATIRARDAGPGMPFARWEAELVAGALREAPHALGLPGVLGSTTVVVRPDGSSVRSSAVIAVPVGQTVITENQAAARINNHRARDPRLANTTVGFVHPLQAAAVLTTTLPELHAFRPGESVAAALLGPVNDYEGAFVTVRDPTGRPIRAVGFANTTGAGFSWSSSSAGSDTVNPQPVPFRP
jgi:hypothetical protein